MRKLEVVAERSVQVFAALAASAFLISGVIYLYLGRWPVTHKDFWLIYDFCLNHTWLESALLKHNSHAVFFPSFLWLTDLRFFHGNQLPLFFAGLLLLFLTVALLLIPVWRDETVGLTAKIIASLVVIMGNFWMARASITASGGFSSMNSLAMVGALLAVLVLPKVRVSVVNIWPATLIIVCAGFVASFSFGTGLAIWPTLFFLAWCLRVPWQSFVPLGIAAVAAMVTYERLPPHSEHSQVIQSAGSALLALVAQLCRLVGSPFFYAASGWHEKALSAAQSMLSLWCGAAGLAVTVIVMVFTMIRRDLTKSSLKLIGMALVTFNFVAMAFVVAGRANHFRAMPFEVGAPRYLFWSTLFWTGLLLMAIQYVESKQWLRWPAYLLALALPVLVFPAHYQSGFKARQARAAAEYGAVSLINGVRDERQVRIFASNPKQIYRVAEQLRARRLDMFADGLQDWIGLAETNLFGGRHKPEKLKGRCVVTALVQSDDGAPAARVIGHALKQGHAVPKTLVIVDPSGVVRGVARSSPTNRFINRTFYLGKVNPHSFLGYIRDYNPQLHYTVRSADDRTLSEEKIPVEM